MLSQSTTSSSQIFPHWQVLFCAQPSAVCSTMQFHLEQSAVAQTHPGCTWQPLLVGQVSASKVRHFLGLLLQSTLQLKCSHAGRGTTAMASRIATAMAPTLRIGAIHPPKRTRAFTRFISPSLSDPAGIATAVPKAPYPHFRLKACTSQRFTDVLWQSGNSTDPYALLKSNNPSPGVGVDGNYAAPS